MLRPLSLVLILFGAACAQAPLVAPAPIAVLSPLTPAQVVQRSGQRLVMDGFSVTTADAASGILTATLTKTGQGDYGPLVTCRFGPNAVGRKGMTTVMTARVATTTAAAGSSVLIGSSTMTTYGPESAAVRLGGGSSSTTDCASTGEIEKRLATALATP